MSSQTLVWLGPPFFAHHLTDLGYTVIQQPHQIDRPRTYADVLSLTGNIMPDAVIVADASTPPLVLDMETFPCLTIFYAIDSHVHSWYPLYAQGFDLCLVSLKDHLPLFTTGRLSQEHVHWFPPFALDHHRPKGHHPITWDMLFVGTVDPVQTPERHSFINTLQKFLPALHVERGPFPVLFPQGKLLLNECSKGDLNFRVFEALGLGGCLLTPHIANGLTELFTDTKDLFLYPPFDVEALLDIAIPLLEEPELRREVARHGLATVDLAHRASHRAKSLHMLLQDLFTSGEAEHLIHRRLALAPHIHEQILRLLYLHHAETVEIPALQEAYLAASRKRPRDLP